MPFGLCGKQNVTEEIHVRIELLDNSVLQLALPRDANGLECLEMVTEKLGISEASYFGLQYVTKRGRDWWLVLDKPIRKQLEQHGQDGCHNTALKFRVHFFVSDFNQLHDEITRYQYYLQLKAYVLERRLSSDEETAVLLASYSTQAELGDLDEEKQINYVRDYVVLPENLFSNLPEDELNQKITEQYRCHRGMTSLQAEAEYIKVVQKLEGYGDEYYPVKDKDGILLLLGASFLGIVVRHPHGLPPVYFRWPDIIRISHSKKYFNIETTKTLDTIQFQMEDPATAKYAWKMFVLHHQFCRLNVSRMAGEAARPRSSSPKLMPKERTLTLTRRSKKEGSQEDMLTVVNGALGSTLSLPDSTGMVNPVFTEDEYSPEYTPPGGASLLPGTNGDVSLSNRPFPAETLGEPSSRPVSLSLCETRKPREAIDASRPVSADLSIQPTRSYALNSSFSVSPDQEEFLVRSSHSSDFAVSPTSTKDCSQEFGKDGRVSEAAGSSLSVDSGNPHGGADISFRTRSFGSLDGAQSARTSTMASMESIPAIQPRPARPTSLNLEGTADDASVLTGPTSSHSTSTDSGLDELDPDAADQQLSREQQLQALRRVLGDGLAFTEFQKIEMRLENRPVTTAELPSNADKNRYKDVLPYEETRVRLNAKHNAINSDYINASHIKMKVGSRQYSYIAAQGPTDETTPDFWQMIWEHRAKVVVMATEDNATTNPKNSCHRYWPDDDRGATATFGSFRIRTEDVRDASPYKVRCLQVEHVPSKTLRTVHHLQFTAWPDHGVPKDSSDFLEFLEELESLRQRGNKSANHHQEPAPLVVHCTAGVGRTGVILLSDLVIACLQNNQRINIPRTLVRLRRQRMLLVANYGQYRFVYTTVVQYISSSRLI